MSVDPVCGAVVDPATAKTLSVAGERWLFCSDFCRAEYAREAGLGAQHETPASRRIAYFTMELCADPRMPTYSGGLGVLAGDMLRACADLQVPIVGVTLLHRAGYFRQRLDPTGRQTEEPVRWRPAEHLTRLEPTVSVPIANRHVQLRAWRYDFLGARGYVVPAFFLDADLEPNAAPDRALTDVLYGGDAGYRLAQELLLGVGGVRMLEALGYEGVRTLHLNEGHAALAAVELLRRRAERGFGWEPEAVRRRCVFTTHTPVPAGHDQFEWPLAEKLLEPLAPRSVLERHGGADRLNMTLLALALSHRVNGVAASHEQVSEHLFPGRDIRHVTNGVHSVTWTCERVRALFDRHLPHWRDDPAALRMASSLPRDELWSAHEAARRVLIETVREKTGVQLDAGRLTIGFARRSTDYKRPDLIFHDVERLRRSARGRLQLLFAGKAHARDEVGKALIRRIVELAAALGADVPVVYLPDYDVELARTLIAGSDVWLNTPLRPLEASGTSGMKAAHNGVPSLSILDGWWVEGCVEGVTGWAIGTNGMSHPIVTRPEADERDAADLYDKLFDVVLPLFHGPRDRWVDVMRSTVALNASYFNAHRMVQQYVTSAWLPGPALEKAAPRAPSRSAA